MFNCEYDHNPQSLYVDGGRVGCHECDDESIYNDFIMYLNSCTVEQRNKIFDKIFERFCKLCGEKIDKKMCYCAPQYDI